MEWGKERDEVKGVKKRGRVRIQGKTVEIRARSSFTAILNLRVIWYMWRDWIQSCDKNIYLTKSSIKQESRSKWK